MGSRLVLAPLLFAAFAVAGQAASDHADRTPRLAPQESASRTFSLELFAPGVVSTGLEEGVLSCTPEGRECFWSIRLSGLETILTARLEDGRWTTPQIAPFAGRYFDGWPAIQPDGKRLFFHSARPTMDPVSGPPARFNIWYVERVGKGWGEPRMVRGEVNGNGNATCPSVTRDGTLYLSKVIGDSPERLCRSRLVGDVYTTLEVLPPSVNAAKDNFHGYIAPDESYLIRPLSGRADAVNGPWNYYVSFRSTDGQWSELISLGGEAHSVYCAGAPSISGDGRWIFLQGRVRQKEVFDLGRLFSLGELLDRENSTSNGSADVYRIDARLIERLRAAAPRPK